MRTVAKMALRNDGTLGLTESALSDSVVSLALTTDVGEGRGACGSTRRRQQRSFVVS